MLVRPRKGFNEVYIDGGVPSGVIKPPKRIDIVGKEESLSAGRMVTRFIGSTCLNDTLFTMRFDANIKAGDILVFNQYGAYTLGCCSDFHLWERPVVRVID